MEGVVPMKSGKGRDYALYAELFKRKGEQSKAKENLRYV